MASDQNYKPELILRTLRAYRVQLCYGYCNGMIEDAIKDSVKIQLLETCNQLRLRATLLPAEKQIFRLGKSDTQENLTFIANQQLRNHHEFSVSECAELTVASVFDGSVC